MRSKTTFKKNGQEVTVSECYKIIQGKIKYFCIEETEQYFESEKRANRAANDLLLKKTLTKFRYAERKEQKRKKIGANRIIKIHKCVKDTEQYIKRWDGIIYLKTKKLLCDELHDKLKTECETFGFKNVQAAYGFVKRITGKN